MDFKTWDDFMKFESRKLYFRDLMKKINNERKNVDVFPSYEEMFSCLWACPLNRTRVVIIGQDPYHQFGQAHGMSFSVKTGVKIPPSLRNIFKELKDDIGIDMPKNGFLGKWAEQGVLLMNTSWSVEKGKPSSHSNFGWMEFSKNILEVLNNFDRPLVFILWGAHAQKVGQKISNPKHFKIKSPHPSPLSASRGFFGSKPFSKANDFLIKSGQGAIDWKIK